eukprot:7149045-Pyramimonas_sp.AAC.1
MATCLDWHTEDIKRRWPIHTSGFPGDFPAQCPVPDYSHPSFQLVSTHNKVSKRVCRDFLHLDITTRVPVMCPPTTSRVVHYSAPMFETLFGCV